MSLKYSKGHTKPPVQQTPSSEDTHIVLVEVEGTEQALLPIFSNMMHMFLIKTLQLYTCNTTPVLVSPTFKLQYSLSNNNQFWNENANYSTTCDYNSLSETKTFQAR
jgi:hypothetical protein